MRCQDRSARTAVAVSSLLAVLASGPAIAAKKKQEPPRLLTLLTLDRLCAEVELGEGRVGTCLLENKSKVSEGCRKAIDDVGLEAVEE